MTKEAMTGKSLDSAAQKILSQLRGTIPLAQAKQVMEKVEAYAKARGKACVIAVCDSHGNPVAVHVMEGAFLVSFEAAMQKAYSAVAVKMDTLELYKLVQPGATFYGLEAMQNGKIVAFGGGVPLKIQDAIVGGLGISGGTGEEDHEIASYGREQFEQMEWS